MSKMTINHIMDRIKVATCVSPIAVFRTETPGLFNAVFANTVITKGMIAAGTYKLVGVYDSGMDLCDVKNKLIEAAK